MDSFDKEPNIRRPNTKETRREDGKLRSKELEALFRKTWRTKDVKKERKINRKINKKWRRREKKTKRSKWRYGKQTIEMIHRTIRETQHSAVETKFRNKMTDAYVRKLIMFQRINQKVQVDTQPIRRDWK